VKDPDDGNLDRIQIIKGWTKNGQIFEKVYDVAWSGERKPGRDEKLPPAAIPWTGANATWTIRLSRAHRWLEEPRPQAREARILLRHTPSGSGMQAPPAHRQLFLEARLVKAATGSQLWARSYEREVRSFSTPPDTPRR
jgi:hypothetical protein